MSHLSITIKAPIAQVWEYIADIESHVHWMRDAQSIAPLNNLKNESGAQYLCVTKVGPLTTDDIMEVVSYDPPHKMTITHVGAVTGSGEFILKEIDENTTQFTWSEHLIFPWYMGAQLGKVVGMKLLHRIWKKNLRTLKSLIET